MIFDFFALLLPLSLSQSCGIDSHGINLIAHVSDAILCGPMCACCRLQYTVRTYVRLLLSAVYCEYFLAVSIL